MSGNIRLFVLAAGIGLLALTSPAAHLRVFVLTGQSNSLGTTADPSEPDITTGVDPADMNTRFFWSNRDTSGDNTPAGVIGDSGGMITHIQAQQGQAANPLFWGPEVQFARSLYAAGVRDVMIIKASRGGGGNTWWFKNAANPQMYQHVVTIVNQAVAALPPEDTFEIVGFLYLQGESDTSAEANISGSRLATLISNLRQDLPHATNMHAVVGGIAAAGFTRDIVRTQQAVLAAGDPTIDYFSTLDLQGNLYDNLHFDKPAKLIVGDRYAQAFLAGSVFATHPVIAEIVAVNTGTLADENGDPSGWIEILNPGYSPVDLSDYRLTDDAGNTAKWRFPPGVSLTAGARRVVFCSGKDRTPVPGELHTNFTLSEDGGYLALHDAGGSLLQAFDPAVPQMFADRSYGTPDPTPTDLVALGHPLRIRVPTDGSLGTNWISRTYDDSDSVVWSTGATGVGYEAGLPPPRDSSMFDFHYGFDETDTRIGAGDPLPENIDNYSPAGADWFVGAGFPGATATNGSIQHVAGSSGNWWEVNPVWTDPGAGITSESGYTLELRARITTGNGPAGKVMGVLGGPVASTTSGTFLNLAEDEVIWRTTVLPLGSGDNTGAMHVFRVAQRPGETSFLVWRDHVLIGQDLAGGHDSFPGRMILGDIGNAWTGAAEIDSFRFTSGAYSPPGASAAPLDPLYTGLIGTDTSATMFGAHPGAYLRIPFELDAAPADVASLMLDVRYDDGFIAWINGVEVARRNAPAVPAWDDVAQAGRDDRFSVYPEHIDVRAGIDALVIGTNLLAVHALNHVDSATRFLFLPELRATIRPTTGAYLSSPTPGADNGDAISALEAWRVEFFSPAELLDEAVSGLTADPDLDGRSNALEFSCVTDPRVPTPGIPGVFTMASHEDGGITSAYLTVQFRLRLAADELAPLVDVSPDLLSWNPGPPPHTVSVGSPAYNGDGSETHTVREASPAGSAGFMRLGMAFLDR